MFTVIRNTLRKSRGSLTGWGIGLAALGILMGSMFDLIFATDEMLSLIHI